ncbi:UbiD family decarboxylase domain-containing protein, partial [Rhizobiaceae sp. 2RAB30]
MKDQSLRGLLSALEVDSELHRVERTIDPRFEIASVLSLRERGPAQLFEKVNGHAMPVVGNVFNSRDRFAQALGVAKEDLDGFSLSALRNPIRPVMVKDAPVQQVVHTDAIDIGALLPVPHWFEREGAPYITAGVIFAKDPETGRRNVSIARLRLEGGNRLMA